MKLSKVSVYWHLGEGTRKFKGLLILLVGLGGSPQSEKFCPSLAYKKK